MITKWNYYLQGANIIVQNDHKPLAQYLNGKNANNKVNRWSLELATYNITFEWISGAKNKAVDCLSRLVLPTGNSINMLTASVNDGPAFHTRSHTQSTSDSTSTPPVMPQPHISQDNNPTPKSLTDDCRDALLQMQHTDPFCKCISKRLLNGKAPHHKSDTFTHIKGLLYKHVSDAGKQFLTLVIPKSWKFTILVEAHDKLGHQENNHMYCLIKWHYYWKGMNKDIRKYIANFKNKQPGKWDLKWQPRYWIVRIEHNGYYIHIENQATGKTQSCNITDIILEPPIEFWNIDTQFGKASCYINHPSNLPTIQLTDTPN